MWKIRDQYIIDDADGQVICCWGSYTTKRKAQLIAAAPKLLAALKLAQQIIGHPDDSGSKIIAAAIKKATRR